MVTYLLRHGLSLKGVVQSVDGLLLPGVFMESVGGVGFLTSWVVNSLLACWLHLEYKDFFLFMIRTVYRLCPFKPNYF